MLKFESVFFQETSLNVFWMWIFTRQKRKGRKSIQIPLRHLILHRMGFYVEKKGSKSNRCQTHDVTFNTFHTIKCRTFRLTLLGKSAFFSDLEFLNFLSDFEIPAISAMFTNKVSVVNPFWKSALITQLSYLRTDFEFRALFEPVKSWNFVCKQCWTLAGNSKSNR